MNENDTKYKDRKERSSSSSKLVFYAQSNGAVEKKKKKKKQKTKTKQKSPLFHREKMSLNAHSCAICCLKNRLQTLFYKYFKFPRCAPRFYGW